MMSIFLCSLCSLLPLHRHALELGYSLVSTSLSPSLLAFAMPGVRGEVKRSYFLCSKTLTLKEAFDGILHVCHWVQNIYWPTKCFTSPEECEQGNKSISALYDFTGSRVSRLVSRLVTVSLIYCEPFTAFWPTYHVEGGHWRENAFFLPPPWSV